MKRNVLLVILLFTVTVAEAQQDTQFSQYIFNSIYINPAYAGYKEDLFVQSYFRSQWVGVNGAPRTFSIAADAGLENEHVGLGITLNKDQIGAQSVLSSYANYSYRIQIGEDENSRLAFGLAAGIMQLGIDGSQLNAIQAGDPTVPVSSQSRLIPDANVGAYYSNNNYFMSLSASNLVASFVKNDNSQNLLIPVPKPHVYLTGGMLIDINENVKFKPVLLLKDDFKGPTTLDVDGFILMNERLSFGAFYRSSVKIYPKNNLQTNLPSQNAFGGIVEFFATSNVVVSYSYDQAVNALGPYNIGSHELSVGFYFGRSRSNSQNSERPRCYKF